MVKYFYTLNEKGLTERNVAENYPDLDVLQRGIKTNRKPDVIKKRLLKAYEGLAEQPLIEKENEWWDVQNAIQELQVDLESLNTDNEEEIKTDIEEIKKNLIEKYNVNKDTDVEEHIQKLISEKEILREELETETPWLKSYRLPDIDESRPTVEFSIPREKMKILIAHERDLEVRNLEDSVADIAKTNSLLFKMISIIYGSLSDSTKDNIADDEKQVIEYAISKFALAHTRADYQFQKEGVALIDKLFDREVKIADIVEKYNK